MFITPVSLISRRGDRYILPVFFAVGLLSALALWGLALLVIKYLPTWVHRFHLTPTRLAGTVIAVQAALVLSYHPYYLAYYNPVLGGYRTAPYRLNVGWGEGLDLAARYLNDLNPKNPPPVAAWYSNQFAPFYHGKAIDLSDQSSALTGQYTVFYLNQIQRGFPSREILTYFQQREPLQVIKLGGIAYAWIYPGPVVSQEPPEQYAFPTQTILAGGARLVGVDVPRLEMPVDAYPQVLATVQAETLSFFGDTWPGLPVTLYWETVGRIRGEHNIYVRLVDEAGHTWGQVDRLILAGLWRPDRWHSGYFLRDEYRLPIDPATPPGTYHLEVGMYDFVTGQSYGVIKNIGTITLTPPGKLPQPAELKPDILVSTPVNEALTLVGHDYSDSQAAPGAELTGKIFWQATQAVTKDYLVEFSFVSAADHKKYVIAEAAISPTYPPTRWRPTEVVGAGYRFRVPAVAPAGNYPLLVTIIDPDTYEPVAPAITLAQVAVQAHERNFDLPKDVTPISAFLNDEIELVGYKLLDPTVAPRESFGLTLYWRSLQPAAANYTVFVHAIGPDQAIRGQWDSVPGEGNRPTSGWLPGEIIEDHFEVPMVRDAPPWKYDIFVGMYDPLTGQRLPTSSDRAPVSENRIWLTRIQVKEK
jgi:hypothetical protein